jgi:hypothetical protein
VITTVPIHDYKKEQISLGSLDEFGKTIAYFQEQMLIFKLNNKDVIAYKISKGNIVILEGDNNEIFASSPKEQTALVLDHETYFKPDQLQRIFSSHPYLQKVNSVYSPHEAIGAHIQFSDPEYDGDISVVNYESNQFNAYTVVFSNLRYHCKGKANNCNKQELAKLTKSVLNLSEIQFSNFEKFLGLQTSDGKYYGEIIKEAYIEYDKGAEEYNEILTILDIPEWAHIKLNDLIAFKEGILEKCSINVNGPWAMTGWFGYLFSPFNSTSTVGNEKIYGAWHLLKYQDKFYSKTEVPISIGIYCYPEWVKLPVFEAQSDYSEYSVPKNIELLNMGSITMYRGEEPLLLKIDQKQERIKLKVNLDGNQNLILTVDSETHMLI